LPQTIHPLFIGFGIAMKVWLANVSNLLMLVLRRSKKTPVDLALEDHLAVG
jgi:hypothetical protein